MRETQRVGDLALMQDLEFQHRAWMVQRAGWVLMALAVLAALLGLLGSGGPWSRASAGMPGTPSPAQVDYDRFGRVSAPTTLELRLAPYSAQAGQVSVWLNSEYLAGVGVERVTPVPERMEAGPGRLAFVFALRDAQGPMAVKLHLKPERPGLLKGELALDNGQVLRFRQFIYP